MIITALDASVLIAIAKGEKEATEWVNLLIKAQREGSLVICPVVAAEFFALLMDKKKFRTSLNRLGIDFSPISLESAQLAGSLFKKYRLQGGPREHLIPDFLIGAHAQNQAHRIAAIDRGYFRNYFSRLKVLKPS